MLAINFTPFPELSTQRLVLRQPRPSDAEAMSQLRSIEVMNRYINRPKSLSEAEALILIDKLNGFVKDNISVFWSVTCKPHDILIGTACLWNISNEHARAELGYELHPDFQGKGIMREAVTKVMEYGFRQMNLESIEAVVNEHNEASIKLLERFNFKRDPEAEGRIAAGELKEYVVYSLNKTQ